MSTLNELRELEDGWSGPGTFRVPEAALVTAEKLTFVPLTSGGVQIELYTGEMEVEIEISSDGTIRSVFVERA